MEQAQDPTARAPAQGASPVKAAIVLLLVVALALTAWSLTGRGNDTTPTQAPAAQPPAVPSEQEIIAEFERLDALRHQAFENVDPSLISKIAYPGSPHERILTKSLRLFLHKDVVPTFDVTVHRTTVSQLGSDSATLLQVITERARFSTQDGRDVTVEGGPFRQEIRWTLRRLGAEWRIFDALVLESRRVRR